MTLSSVSAVAMSSCTSWGYTEKNGPATWVKNLNLKIGDRQSPIDIVRKSAVFDETLKKLIFKYPSFEECTLTNNGCTVLFTPAEGGNSSVVSDGAVEHKYQLAQFHFHWGKVDNVGSEHTVDGKSYPAELHLVHWNTDLYSNAGEALTAENGLVVFGIFLELGDEDHIGLNSITSKLSEINESGSKVTMPGSFNPSCLFPDSLDYWSYPGSLTTPPLSESVTWVVFEKPIQVSKKQVAAFRELTSKDGGKLCENWRPTCPVNNRLIKSSFQ